MTFEEANVLPRFNILGAFGIEAAECTCDGCSRYEGCRAREEFEYFNPSDTITECDFKEEE